MALWGGEIALFGENLKDCVLQFKQLKLQL